MSGPNFYSNENSQKTFGSELKTTVWGSYSPIHIGMPGQKELSICQVSSRSNKGILDFLHETIFK